MSIFWKRLSPLVLLSLSLGLLLSSPAPVGAAAAHGEHGVAATVHPLATAAAISAMKQGGNAIDAAIAAALTLGVVDGYNSGLGGGCFLLIHRANGSVVAIDGRERAPAAATRNMFLREGKAAPRLSETGALAIATPGALAAYEHAVRRYGRLPLKTHLLAAAQIAEQGFTLEPGYASRLAGARTELKEFPSTRAIFLRPDGEPWRAGELLLQPDLAATYRQIAREGANWFYRGAFAQATEQWMRANGGLMTARDFRRYEIKRRTPIRTTYRGCEIIGFPPPSSGGVHVAEILNVLENFDLKALGANSADFVHVVTEAMKLAFADRAHWLGDPDFVRVPRGLVDKSYAAKLAKQIRLDRATPVPQHGTPDRADKDIFSKHTTHFSTADAEGNWVACTATINTTFGAKVVIPGTGVVMNNEMDDFAAAPGTANFYGLISAEANAVAPLKRPLSSMSPTIVLREGRPILSVGAAGGPTIISQTLLAIVHTIDFGRPVEEALAQPRFHHQWQPDELRIERQIGELVIRELARRGHRIAPVDSLGAAQAVAREGTGFSGAHDPRVSGQALGW